MAGRIRQEDVDAVRQRSDLVKIVSDHLQLKKTGADAMAGLCPFHPEKTPSFTVSPAKQVYYCFGCGEGGDLFKFIQKVENLTFGEAVERLASQTGINLRYEGESKSDRRAAGHRQVLHKAVAAAGDLYRQMLLDGREAAEARAYLQQRGITRESVERFGVGYAPGYSDFLLRRLASRFSAEILVEAGLVSKDSDGNLRDRFRGRVIFPIHDVSGSAVGFGGRLLAGPKAPPNAAKYVNSPDSTLYRKGNLLYNLNRAKADITKAARAFLVEGYTDVIALDQVGIPQAVATCGTALGEEHLRLLSRFTERVILAFDSDEAGARAADRAFQYHEQYPVDVSVLVLPEGQDPADFALARGAEAGAEFESLLERAVPLVAYRIDRVLVGRTLTDAEEQARAVRDALPVVAGLKDQVLRERYAAYLADKVGVSPNAVLLELDRLGEPMPAVEIVTPGRASPTQKVEREALKLLVQAPELSESLNEQLTGEHFTMATHQEAFALIRESAPAGASVVVLAQDRGERLSKLVARLAVEPLEVVGEPTSDYVRQVGLRLEEFLLDRRVNEARKQLEKLNPLKAADEYDRLSIDFAHLVGALRRVREEQADTVVSSI